MSPGTTIRPARPADAALVCEFIRELAEYERLAGECEATPAAVSASLFAPAPRVFCDIAEMNGEPAGFALWCYNYSTFRAKHGIYLEDLYVRPSFRGLGIGKALMVHLARRAVAEDCGRFEWSVLDWNESSIAFYKMLGARAMKDWMVFRLDRDALEKVAEL